MDFPELEIGNTFLTAGGGLISTERHWLWWYGDKYLFILNKDYLRCLKDNSWYLTLKLNNIKYCLLKLPWSNKITVKYFIFQFPVIAMYGIRFIPHFTVLDIWTAIVSEGVSQNGINSWKQCYYYVQNEIITIKPWQEFYAVIKYTKQIRS